MAPDMIGCILCGRASISRIVTTAGASVLAETSHGSPRIDGELEGSHAVGANGAQRD